MPKPGHWKPTDPGYEEYISESKGPQLYAIFTPLMGMAIVLVGLRLYCRVRFIGRLVLSDWLMAAAVMVTSGMSAMIHMQIKTGMGRHVEYSRERPSVFALSLKVGYVQNIMYQAGLGILKTSILMQYHNIAIDARHRRIIVGVMTFVVIFCTYVTLAAIFECIPVSAAFNLATFPKGCWNMAVSNYVTSSINTVSDVVIYTMPLPVLLKLNVKKKRKVSLIATFCVGLVAVITSIVLLTSLVMWNGLDDFTYDACMIPIYGAVEVYTGMMAACLPQIKPLIKRIVRGICDATGWSRSNDSGTGTGDSPRSLFKLRSFKKRDPFDLPSTLKDDEETILAKGTSQVEKAGKGSELSVNERWDQSSNCRDNQV